MIESIKSKLVADWRKAYKWLSVQLAAALFLMQVAYEYLPAVHDYLPEGWAKWIALVIIAARILKQGKDNDRA